MSGIIRPPRGRPNKVAKPSAPARRPGRGHVGSPGKPGTHYEADIVDDLNAAAAAAAATAAIAAAAEMGDGEADGEMEEDDQDPNVNPSAGLPHTESVDLNTAANILANGGGAPGVVGMQDQHPIHSHHHQQQQQQQQQQHHHHHHQPPAPMGGPQDVGPADHGHPHNLDPSFVKPTEEMARESGYGSLNIDSGLAKRLAREPGMRLATQRRADQHLNLARRSNVEALFAHIAGELAPTPCKNCHKGHGPWNSCVIVDGQMCGSCANCWFNASGARCSFHEARNPQTVHPSSLLGGGGGGGGGANGGGPPPDHAGSFAMQQSLSLGSAHNTLAALNLSGPMSSDPIVRYTIERAMADVRAADRKTRQMMMIEIAAKQLALQIIEYEETLAVEQQQGHPQNQQGLGGDGGA